MTIPVDPVAAANLAAWFNCQPPETWADSARQIGRSFYDAREQFNMSSAEANDYVGRLFVAVFDELCHLKYHPPVLQ
jgi:hypothetical protein